jgi:hypothetical protein
MASKQPVNHSTVLACRIGLSRPNSTSEYAWADGSPVDQAVQYDSAHPHWAWAHPQLAGLAGYHCVAAHTSYQYERYMGDPYNATQARALACCRVVGTVCWLCARPDAEPAA